MESAKNAKYLENAAMPGANVLIASLFVRWHLGRKFSTMETLFRRYLARQKEPNEPQSE